MERFSTSRLLWQVAWLAWGAFALFFVGAVRDATTWDSVSQAFDVAWKLSVLAAIVSVRDAIKAAPLRSPTDPPLHTPG